MASLNKCMFIGNLGRNPDVKYTQGGEPVANFSIACSDSWTGKDGQRQERTEWINIVAWGKLADIAGKYLTKGRQVYVEGRLSTREYTGKDQQQKKVTEITATQIVLLGARPEQDKPAATSAVATSRPVTDDDPIGDEDIPFMIDIEGDQNWSGRPALNAKLKSLLKHFTDMHKWLTGTSISASIAPNEM